MKYYYEISLDLSQINTLLSGRWLNDAIVDYFTQVREYSMVINLIVIKWLLYNSSKRYRVLNLIKETSLRKFSVDDKLLSRLSW